ncbi:uncharacterized protein BCR38DRAFT_435921 [Pseudomassariella vexata]|uniref:Uncharacterized protein n=1 Tax=Pseudomassariella vexata TaxID=1141098 RepID=A0A1Y2DV96_9PEZI|nr:uncharacterized protein BCR38DRAFT_435921 [Pseudomassariella vexata]ORY63119.1 hypothetical protein BCR38DRAFT_435921 [Pseudomassariella vexata]
MKTMPPFYNATFVKPMSWIMVMVVTASVAACIAPLLACTHIAEAICKHISMTHPCLSRRLPFPSGIFRSEMLPAYGTGARRHVSGTSHRGMASYLRMAVQHMLEKRPTRQPGHPVVSCYCF